MLYNWLATIRICHEIANISSLLEEMSSNIKLLLYFPLLYQQWKVARDIYYYSISPINALTRPLIFNAGHLAPFFF